MDEPVPGTKQSVPRFPWAGVLIIAATLSGVVFGGMAFSAYGKYKDKENPREQVRDYLRYLDSCLVRIDRKKESQQQSEAEERESKERIKKVFGDDSDIWKSLGKKPSATDRDKRIDDLTWSTGVWRELADRCLDNLDDMRTEIVKVRATVVATVGEDVSRFEVGDRQTLEAFHLPNLTIEDRGPWYYLHENSSAMVGIPFFIGLGVVGLSLVSWIAISVMSSLSAGGRATRIIFPWTYPHLGWRRLSFVFAPVFAGVAFLLLHEEDSQIPLSIGALLTGAPLLLIGREIGVWIQKGFRDEATVATPQKNPPDSSEPGTRQ